MLRDFRAAGQPPIVNARNGCDFVHKIWQLEIAQQES